MTGTFVFLRAAAYIEATTNYILSLVHDSTATDTRKGTLARINLTRFES